MSASRAAMLVGALALAAGCRTPARERARVLAKTEAALAAGALDRAESGLRAMLRYDPRDREVALRLAQILLAQGRAAEASEVLETLPEDVPLDSAMQRLHVRLWLQLGSLPEAARTLASAAEPDEELKDELLRRLVPDADARAVVALRPAWREELAELLVREGARAAAIGVYEGLRTAGLAGAEVHVRLAELLLEEERPADARKALLGGAASHPRRAPLELEALLRTGRVAEASSVATTPELRGVLLGRLAQAPADARELERLPASFAADVAGALVDAGRLELAAPLVGRIPGAGDRESVRDRWLTRALGSPGTEVLAAHEKLLEGPPSLPRLLAEHRLLSARGRHDLARRVEDELEARYPDAPGIAGILLSRARRLTRSGKEAEGLAAAERAVALDPTSVDALVERALALDALGRVDEARRAFRTVLAASPDHAVARAYLDPERRAEAKTGSFQLRIDATGEGAPASR